MARYQVQGPDGAMHIIEGPDGAKPEDIEAFAAQSIPKAASTYGDRLKANTKVLAEDAKNAGAGLVRGAGSIGATILSPVDYAFRKAKEAGLAPEWSIFGRDDRREGMTAALGTMGADTDSAAFGGGKILGEVGGTAGAGPVLAGVAKAAGAAPTAINALRSYGVTTGAAPVGAAAKTVDMGTRMLGSGAGAFAGAGLADPDNALAAGGIGMALPPAAKVVGLGGQAAGRIIRGADQTPEMAAGINAARQSGYVMPPSQANPSLMNRTMEGFAGKLSTAQNASSKNASITNAKAARDLGLAPDTKITPEVLADVRKNAGQAYEVVKGSGTVTPGKAYGAALDAIEEPFIKAAQGFPDAAPSPVLALVKSLRSESFDAGSAVAKIRTLRTAADDGFRSGNTDVARASKAAAKALEDALEDHLAASNMPDALQKFREARTLYAKTHTVEKALNKETGTVDVRKLGRDLDKGKLTGELKEAAQFAKRFPKAAQTPEQMGSLPQFSPLDTTAAVLMSLSAGNPLPMAAMAARPLTRAGALSGPVQNRLIQSPRGKVDPRLNALAHRAPPQIGRDQ